MPVSISTIKTVPKFGNGRDEFSKKDRLFALFYIK
jgi:hypothetical protein